MKEDLGHSPSEMLYGENVLGPNELIIPSNESLNESKFVKQLKLLFGRLKSVDTRRVIHQKTNVSDDLFNAGQVLVRIDRIRKPFEDAYEGPFKVVKRLGKVIIIDRNGKDVSISMDRVKPFRTILNKHDKPSNSKRKNEVKFFEKRGE